MAPSPEPGSSNSASALPLCSCVTLGKLCNLSGPHLAIIIFLLMLFLLFRVTISGQTDEPALKQKQTVCSPLLKFARTTRQA